MSRREVWEALIFEAFQVPRHNDPAIKPLTPVAGSAMMMRDGQDRHNVVVNDVNNIVRESSDNELTGASSSALTDGGML